MYDVCIIGAGMSGMIAAIEAAKKQKKVLLIDKNKKSGNKIYATGNGKCNLTNTNYNSFAYYNNKFALNVIDNVTDNPSDFIIKYFNELGIYTISNNGYIYPMSSQASSVVWALNDAIRRLNIDLITNTEVTDVSDMNSYYDIESNDHYQAKNIIFACGSKAYPALGAIKNNSVYKMWEKLNIAYNHFTPALCPVHTKENIKELSGVRVKTITKLLKNDKLIDLEKGELQFTDYGVSGIQIFNLSGNIISGEYKFIIDLLPEIDNITLLNNFTKLIKTHPNKTLHSMLNGFINDKIALYIINKCGFEAKASLESIFNINIEEKLNSLITNIKEMVLTVDHLADFDKAQVCRGGVIVNNIEEDTMKLADKRAIFCIGEALDVHGKCGGYNLTWAIISGYIAGKSI